MGYQQHPGDLWDGLEPTPEPPEENNSNRTMLLIGGGIALIVGLAICLVAGYLVLLSRTGGGTTEATAVAVVSTVPGDAEPTTAPPTTPPDTNPVDPTPTLVEATEVPPTEEPTPTEETNVQVSGFAVNRFDAPPAINGNLDDWQGFETIQSQFQVFDANGWDGSDDLEAFWQVGWDDEALYSKMANLARAILSYNSGKGPDVLVLQEVENIWVLRELNRRFSRNWSINKSMEILIRFSI